ncbi:MAG: hypothetical protein H7301_15465 [Cryobacterium sp.]|nr:hypothetical protein [Oligoflexia bacterium]
MTKQEATRSSIPFLLVLTLSLFFSSCESPAGEDAVWVTRPDGSLQCDDPKAAPTTDRLSDAKAVLEKAGVKVIEAKKSADGALRAQMCGIATGNATTLKILKADLSKATAAGFSTVP